APQAGAPSPLPSRARATRSRWPGRSRGPARAVPRAQPRARRPAPAPPCPGRPRRWPGESSRRSRSPGSGRLRGRRPLAAAPPGPFRARRGRPRPGAPRLRRTPRARPAPTRGSRTHSRTRERALASRPRARRSGAARARALPPSPASAQASPSSRQHRVMAVSDRKLRGGDRAAARSRHGSGYSGFLSSAANLVLPVGTRVRPGEVAGYFIDFSLKARAPRWEDGWRAVRASDQHYVVAAQWGLGCYERYLEGEGDAWLAAALDAAEYLLGEQQRRGP